MKKCLIVMLSAFSCLLIVNAETGIVNDSAGLNIRSSASSSSDKLATIPYNKEFYISNTNAGSGNGCSGNWYYGYYNSTYGYVCSSYITIKDTSSSNVLSYGRPWNTPKKSIVGGAEFIGAAYISKGQSTSYLKKFNVNPNGYYSVYNHQYMANLRAPSSEAATSYSSISNNGLLDYAINFLIPVYQNMPESTYDSSIKSIDRYTASVQDESFESSISLFPETYKQYLRYLHSIHPTWTFTMLDTGLDFNTSVSQEKYISSIEISSGMCEQSPYTITEKNWCIATTSATAFFLDPRNFLNEKYIFMFENLSYSEKYDATVVQSVLSSTFMNGVSLLDNQSYASIFVEAGYKANVSPLYLASLARQEIGNSVSTATSGKEFTYEGYTYSGIYNFFNIGAYSSASIPVFAGLVYANGGAGVNNGGIIASPNLISLLQIGTIGGYVKGYSIGTTIIDIKNKVGAGGSVSITDANGNTKNDGDKIGTGNRINVTNGTDNSIYTYVLFGDLTGDGEINSADLLKMRQHLLGISTLNNEYLQSASLTNDSEINSADLLKIRQYLLGISNIDQ